MDPFRKPIPNRQPLSTLITKFNSQVETIKDATWDEEDVQVILKTHRRLKLQGITERYILVLAWASLPPDCRNEFLEVLNRSYV